VVKMKKGNTEVGEECVAFLHGHAVDTGKKQAPKQQNNNLEARQTGMGFRGGDACLGLGGCGFRSGKKKHKTTEVACRKKKGPSEEEATSKEKIGHGW